MNKEQFYNIISDSSLLINIDEQNIDEIIKEFPYFQTAYVLKTKVLFNNGSFKYDNFIKLASLYSVDRSKLFNYLHIDTDAEIIEQADEKTHEIDAIEHITNNKDEQENEINQSDEIEIVDNKLEDIDEEIVVSDSKLVSKIDLVKEEDSEKFDETNRETKTDSVELPEVTETNNETLIEKEEVKTSENIEKTESIQPVEANNVKEKLSEREPIKLREEPIEESLSANATLAEKIIHKYRHKQKSDKTESIADIILRKAAESKKKKTTKKPEPVLRGKPKKIKVEEKTFEPVKLEVKLEQKRTIDKATPDENIKVAEKEAKTKSTEKETIKVENTPTVEVPEIKETKLDILEEINKISEKETISDYFIAEEESKIKSVKEEMTFDDWLNFVEMPIKSSGKNKEQFNLIDKFITSEVEAKIKPRVDEVTDTKQLVKKGELERDDFITETLANIYIKQKLYEKAISAFTKLSLKYPEKNSYFANQIKKIEKLIKK